MTLYLFDLDGTLIESFMRRDQVQPFETVTLLPNVAAWWAAARRQQTTLAIITNQGGVAFGYQTEAEVCAKFQALAGLLSYDLVRIHEGVRRIELRATRPPTRVHTTPPPMVCGTLDIYVSFGDPRTPNPAYQDGTRRKPSPAMLIEAMNDSGETSALYVGDRDEDQNAAAAARTAGYAVRFMDAAAFFHRAVLE